MAAPILWTPGKSAFFLQENLHVHKIPRFLGGGNFGLGGGGGSADFIFMGAGIFLSLFKKLMWHGQFATRFARIDSRESFATETRGLFFVACQSDSHESLDFPIRANHPIRANRANRFARITPLSFKKLMC